MAPHAKTQRKRPWSILIMLFILHLHMKSTSSEKHTDPVIVNGNDPVHELNELINQLQYSKYFKEVLHLLKREDSDTHRIDINGDLNEHLDNAHDRVRSKLDEAKRQELHRIRQLTEELKKRGLAPNIFRHNVKHASKHLDLKNLGKFGAEDLRRLLLESNAELSILDQRRKETFKEYEMHKILEFQELFKRLSPEKQIQVKENRDALLLAHRRQKPVSMPASKEHLMKVWEERDKMNRDNFNVITFFHLHDLDGNMYLDEYEIKMLLENEVHTLYDEFAPDYDPKVKEDELERMREYTFTNVDLDQDHLISMDEFIENTKRAGYDDHVFWENVRKVPLFTDEEFAGYAELNRPEINRWIDEGKISLDLSGIVKHNQGAEGGGNVGSGGKQDLK